MIELEPPLQSAVFSENVTPSECLTSILYAVIGEPPLEVGAVQVKSTAVSCTAVVTGGSTWSGTLAALIDTMLDGCEYPLTFLASTLNQ